MHIFRANMSCPPKLDWAPTPVPWLAVNHRCAVPLGMNNDYFTTYRPVHFFRLSVLHEYSIRYDTRKSTGAVKSTTSTALVRWERADACTRAVLRRVLINYWRVRHLAVAQHGQCVQCPVVVYNSGWLHLWRAANWPQRLLGTGTKMCRGGCRPMSGVFPLVMGTAADASLVADRSAGMKIDDWQWTWA